MTQPDPIAWLAGQSARPRGLWWDLASGRFTAAAGAAAEVRVDAPSTTAEIERAIEEAVTSRPGPWLGAVRFSPRRAPAPEWSRYGAAWLFSPAHLVTGVAQCEHRGSPPRGARCQDGAFEARVRRGLEAIDAATVDKVVLASAFSIGGADRSPASVLRRLCEGERSGTAFWLEPAPGVGFLGVSPERLYERSGPRFHVDALAGTAPVVGESGVDEAAGAALQNDDKELREHRFVSRAVLSAMAPLARSIDAPESPRLRKLGRVQHLWTPIEGELDAPAQLLAALHPTPAVCGSPRAAAAELIDVLEPFDRGLYAGAVGLWEQGGEQVSVALRCARYDEAGYTAYAGAGIVSGSDPAREAREVERKASSVLDAVCGDAREVAA